MLFRQWVTSITTFATLIALVYSLKGSSKDFTRPQQFLLFAAVIVLSIDIILTFRDFRGRTERRYRAGKRQTSRVRDFMYDWLRTGGRATVFSRDLSWIRSDDTSIRELMKQKAEQDELTVVVPKSTALTRELQNCGATIVTYEDLDYVIQSRFTLVGAGRPGARVAIGHAASGAHVIEVVDANHPAFYLAVDLVEVMGRAWTRRSS